MKRRLRDFAAETGGAVAPTIAISLFALIAAGGIAFDYARMVALDTELQNAADQAALAAVGQLDGQAGAIARATNAAQQLVSNRALFANRLEIPADEITVEFYSDYDASTGAKTGLTTVDADANYVLVTIAPHTANFTLTPIVAVFSADMVATAFAGMASAICNTPPVMICNPAEPVGNTNLDYAFSVPRGTGLKLITGNADAPGNFGFLETNFGTGANALAMALGYDVPPGECAATDGVTTKPGLSASVMAAINTRFDISENGNPSCPGTGPCSPSRNARKDLVKGSGNTCGITGNGWQVSPNPYRPTTASALPTDGSLDPDIMGHPRDMCHAVSNSGSCTDVRIGDGNWDRNAYFRVNYGWGSSTWPSQTGLSSSATRYEVYQWELENTGTSDMDQNVGGTPTKYGHSYPVCRAPGLTPGGTTVDRRRISAAVINCEAHNLNGSESNVPVVTWIDLFLVEPSIRRGNGPTLRTEASDVYVEVIEVTQTGSNGSTAGQVIRRDVPRLLE